MSPDEFRSDLMKAKDILEDITGKEIFGYRAPSYSLTNRSLWAFETLNGLGFKYDSSVFPITHDRYGIPDSPRFKYMIPENDLVEFPISTSRILGLKIPVFNCHLTLTLCENYNNLAGSFRLIPLRRFKHVFLVKVEFTQLENFGKKGG